MSGTSENAWFRTLNRKNSLFLTCSALWILAFAPSTAPVLRRTSRRMNKGIVQDEAELVFVSQICTDHGVPLTPGISRTCGQTGAFISRRWNSIADGVQRNGTRRTVFLVRTSRYWISSPLVISSVTQISDTDSRSRSGFSNGKSDASMS